MSKSGSRILFATALGLAVGVGIGLLFAPEKGSKTRKRLKKTILDLAEDAREDLSGKMNDLRAGFAGGGGQAQEENPEMGNTKQE